MQPIIRALCIVGRMQRLALVLLLAAACSPAARNEPTPASRTPAVAPTPLPGPSAPPPAASTSSTPVAAPVAVDAGPPEPEFQPPALTDADGKPLPQTEDKPRTDS